MRRGLAVKGVQDSSLVHDYADDYDCVHANDAVYDDELIINRFLMDGGFPLLNHSMTR
jgi:hypothetical protein